MSTPDLGERYDRLKNAQSHAAAQLSAFKDLEGDIANLTCMARILVDLLDDNMKEIREDGCISYPRDREHLHVLLTTGQLDMLSFAWNNVLVRAIELDKKFHDAFRAKTVSEAAE